MTSKDLSTARMTRSNVSDEFDAQGVLRLSAVLGPSELARLWSSVQPESAEGAVTSRAGAYGARALLVARPELRRALAALELDHVAARVLGEPVLPIDALFFDKNAAVNWAVPAHQDVAVPVPAGTTDSSVRNLRVRHGTTYGEPPLEVLQELVALSVHFDAADENSGGLAVILGSHSRGRWLDADLRCIPTGAFRHYDCHAGDILLMKPLIVHRSPRHTHPRLTAAAIVH
jgi:hypothetical protein